MPEESTGPSNIWHVWETLCLDKLVLSEIPQRQHSDVTQGRDVPLIVSGRAPGWSLAVRSGTQTESWLLCEAARTAQLFSGGVGGAMGPPQELWGPWRRLRSGPLPAGLRVRGARAGQPWLLLPPAGMAGCRVSPSSRPSSRQRHRACPPPGITDPVGVWLAEPLWGPGGGQCHPGSGADRPRTR